MAPTLTRKPGAASLRRASCATATCSLTCAWGPDGSVSGKAPNAPYTTRILVRRPANNSKFSGSVVVELPNTARRFDWAMMWGYLHDQITDHGDAWVLITTPGSIEGMKKFN